MLVAITSDMLICTWEVIVWLRLSQLACAAEDVALTTNQNFVRDFPVAYDILFENISDQARHWPLHLDFFCINVPALDCPNAPVRLGLISVFLSDDVKMIKTLAVVPAVACAFCAQWSGVQEARSLCSLYCPGSCRVCVYILEFHSIATELLNLPLVAWAEKKLLGFCAGQASGPITLR